MLLLQFPLAPGAARYGVRGTCLGRYHGRKPPKGCTGQNCPRNRDGTRLNVSGSISPKGNLHPSSHHNPIQGPSRAFGTFQGVESTTSGGAAQRNRGLQIAFQAVRPESSHFLGLTPCPCKRPLMALRCGWPSNFQRLSTTESTIFGRSPSARFGIPPSPTHARLGRKGGIPQVGVPSVLECQEGEGNLRTADVVEAPLVVCGWAS